MANQPFQTEVNQLLDLMIHSLYSNKEIFLRELISNASDAMEKLQYLTHTDDSLKELDFQPKIEIILDKPNKKIIISDNGIGMSESELAENLGTIARSGTKGFVQQMVGDRKKDSNLIGQFGVGFYSAFMVAKQIVVLSKKPLASEAFEWSSDGKNGYQIKGASKDDYGTQITLELRDDESEFLENYRIESIIKRYSDHIPFPIFLRYTQTKYDKEGKESGEEEKNEQVNKASALWRLPRREISEDEYKEFYKSLSHDSSEPLAWVHTKLEGMLEYTTLFYIPSVAPFDMQRADYQSGVKLYVKRVFITDDDKELLPTYLRFVRGIIDSEDLPLNVSREILQQNKILATIKSASTKKILDEIETIAKDKEKYEKFYAQYADVLKEGVYSDFENRERLLKLLRFASSNGDSAVSFADYKARMGEDQKAIFYLLATNGQDVRQSPLIERFKNRNIEVLFFESTVDSFVMPSVHEVEGIPLCAVGSKQADEMFGEDKITTEDETKFAPLLSAFKAALGERVADVKLSRRLLDSPACVVYPNEDVAMKNILKQMGQKVPESKPTLELNPSHALLSTLLIANDSAKMSDYASLLLDEALLLEGGTLKDAHGFVQRLNTILQRAL